MDRVGEVELRQGGDGVHRGHAVADDAGEGGEAAVLIVEDVDVVRQVDEPLVRRGVDGRRPGCTSRIARSNAVTFPIRD